MFPQKAVLRIPHPTGSRGHFSKLFYDSSRTAFKTKIDAQVKEFFFSKVINGAHWLR